MRKLRLKNDGEGFYHVGSRCVDRTFRFDDDDKTHIVDQMRRMAAFCGMEVNTYSVMTNHFHILLHVLPERELTDDELASRVAALYGQQKAEDCRVAWAAYRRNGGKAALSRLEEERGALLRRMGDLSKYMKELKQWISRDYKWCGYAEAHAGREAAQKALAAIFRDSPGIAWADAEERYGWLLHAVSDTSAGGKSEQDAVFRRALALGSRGFILETYARFREVFNARRRPAEPFVTDIGETADAICASHKPRRLGVG